MRPGAQTPHDFPLNGHLPGERGRDRLHYGLLGRGDSATESLIGSIPIATRRLSRKTEVRA